MEKTQLDHFARAGGLPYSLRTGVFVIPLAGITKTETPKHRNSYFFLYFFFSNTETHNKTNSANVSPVENFDASGKWIELGLQS